MNLNKLSITEVQEGLKNKDFSCQELVMHYLDRIENNNNELNSYLSVFSDEARLGAREVDDNIRDGVDFKPLTGVPIAIKDNMMMTGKLTTAGSKILSDYYATYTATSVQKLIDAGAVIMGKTNLDEFAMGSSGETSAFGPTKNPIDTTKVPGGSSAGSAVAVADDECVASLGSDTGGSIRLPASFCGLVGLKPTYGLVSRYGLIAMASSFDQIGPFTRNCYDAALMLNVIAGQDSFDATTVATKKDYTKNIKKNIKGLRIGLPKEFFVKGMDPIVEQRILEAVNVLRDLGAEVKEVSLPNTRYALSTYYVLMPAEVSSNLARFDGVRYGFRAPAENIEEMYLNTRSQGFGDEVKRRIMLGTYVLSEGYSDEYYKRAQKLRGLIKADLMKVFEEVDVLACPTAPMTAFNLGEKFDDPLTMYLADVFTVSANVAGIPAMSIPCGFKDNLPIGLQLLGNYYDEETLLRVGYNFEQVKEV